MDNLLIFLGVLGFGAVIISIHLISERSRRRKSGTAGVSEGESPVCAERRPGDRRSGEFVIFPLIVNRALIHEDRRTLPDRRLISA